VCPGETNRGKSLFGLSDLKIFHHIPKYQGVFYLGFNGVFYGSLLNEKIMLFF
jgi:hypothetical protein